MLSGMLPQRPTLYPIFMFKGSSKSFISLLVFPGAGGYDLITEIHLLCSRFDEQHLWITVLNHCHSHDILYPSMACFLKNSPNHFRLFYWSTFKSRVNQNRHRRYWRGTKRTCALSRDRMSTESEYLVDKQNRAFKVEAGALLFPGP